MDFSQLGRTGINVSRVCLGTMTFGEQNSPEEAFAQMDCALDSDINFFDTAELYSIPPKAETFGRTEEIIGDWFAKSGRRDEVILASKVVGRSMMKWFRGEESRLSSAHIREAIEGSLKRLKTDYIDLYQIHWPDRNAPIFGAAPSFEKVDASSEVAIEETLDTLSQLVKEGLVRAIGVSNETPWGVSEYLRLSVSKGFERIASIQNAYSLVNRSFESGLAEFSLRDDVGLLAYSPLAQGYLSGKYRHGELPARSRKAMFNRMQRYESKQALSAMERYFDLAESQGLTPTELAQAFVMNRSFVTSNIIGATSLEQLQQNIEACSVVLGDDVLKEIDKIHADSPNPAP